MARHEKKIAAATRAVELLAKAGAHVEANAVRQIILTADSSAETASRLWQDNAELRTRLDQMEDRISALEAMDARRSDGLD